MTHRLCQLVTILIATIFAAPALARAQFRQSYVTAEVEVLSEFSLDNLRGELDALTDLKSDLHKTLNLQPVEGPLPVRIYLFSSKWSYRSYLAQRIPEAVNRPAAFAKGTDALRVYAYRSTSLTTDLRHETTHAFLHQSLAFVPIWLDEGLAEYFEVPAKDRFSGNPHLREIRMATPLLWRPDLEKLAGQNSLAQMGRGDYREAWAWAHFLIHGPQPIRDCLTDYVATIQQHDVPPTLNLTLQQKLGRPEEALRDHLSRIR